MVHIISYSNSSCRISSPCPSSSGSDSGYSDCSRIYSDSILSSRSSNSHSSFKGPQTIGQMTIDMVYLGYIVEFDENRNVIRWYKS